MNRRALVGYGLGGAALGSIWSGGLTLGLRMSTPTLSVIGDGDAQLALLNTAQFRAIIVIGAPSDYLIGRIPSLLGVLRRRVDLVIGSAEGIGLLGRDFADERNVARSIALDEAQFPAATMARLPEGVVLRMQTAATQEWNRDDKAPTTWLVTIQRGKAFCALGPDLDRMALLAPPEIALGIAPGGSLPILSRKLPSIGIAANAENIDEAILAAPQGANDPWIVRIHPSDPAVFSLETQGIRLPTWSEQRSVIR